MAVFPSWGGGRFGCEWRAQACSAGGRAQDGGLAAVSWCARLDVGPVLYVLECLTYGLLFHFTREHGSLLSLFAASGRQACLKPAPRLRCPERCQLAVPLSPFGLQSGTSHEGHLLLGEDSLCL